MTNAAIGNEYQIAAVDKATKTTTICSVPYAIEDSASEVLPECLNLYAKADILYSSHQYSLGEELPTDNPQMIDAWLRADTAEWR